MRKSSKIKQLLAASAVTLALFSAAPNAANAGPLLCVGTAAAAAVGWLSYGIFKVVSAPVTIWTTPAEVGVLAAAGGETVGLVTAACAAPTP